ncbi:hypothetical protein J4448_03635 [Candidatus Woesearchaeota archaeon]|nr:hypothetical protein [Candidatus Woesearchaeota archaeon]
MARETPEQRRQREEAERLEAERRRIILERERIALARERAEAETTERQRQEAINRAHEEALEENKRIGEQRMSDQSLRGRVGNKIKRAGEAYNAKEDAFVNSAINLTVNTATNRMFWLWFVIIVGGTVYFLWYYGKLKIVFLTFLQILLFLLFGLLIFFGIRIAFKSQDKIERSAAIFIVLAFVVWGIDLLPANIPIIGDYLGPPYAGFKFDLSGLLTTNWAAVITSSYVFIALLFGAFYDLAKKRPILFLINFSLILVINQIFNYYNILGLGRTVNSSYINYIFLGILIIGFFLAFKFRNHFQGTDLAGYPTFLFMNLVFSFFWVNIGWITNVRAFIHVLFILAFGFGYVARNERDNPTFWHMLIPGLLIADFYGYGLLWNSGIDVFRFIPILVLFVLFYCYARAESTYALVSLFFVLGIFLIFTIQSLGVDATSIPFEAKRGADYKDFYTQFKDKVREMIEGRLDIATAGLYRGNVEKNRYESLGVYFGNIRAADPRFYTDEPITVWGTLRSKTYKDAVIVNFSCYRWKDNKKIRADKIIPEIIFPIFTLEEVDTQCTFLPKTESPTPAGANIVTFSAEYNFGTDAYLKTYFIDRERFRASAREGIEPLTQFGIKDKTPAAVFTNGPVEIGLGAGPLVTVSEGYAIKPTISITLTNRKEISDKDKRIITRWEGKIKNITELILLTPPGITLQNTEKCKEPKTDLEKLECPCSMPFESYDIHKCFTSCNKQILEPCNRACEISNPTKNQQQENCINECVTATDKCTEECNFLFQVNEGEGSTKEKYNAYALDVGSKQFRDLNKDIDKSRSFVCRFDPTPAVLDDTPITTRYFRVRTRYNYLLENSVTVNVETVPVGAVNTVPEPLAKTTSEFIQVSGLRFDGLTSELVSAIASVESRFRHCCQDASKNRAGNCVDSGKKECPFEELITSGSSFGIMQIKYNTKESKDWVDSLSRQYCGKDSNGNDININNYECNVKVGIAILKSKYDQFRYGCKATSEYKSQDRVKYKTFIDGCENGVTSSGVRYDSYRDYQAAIRGYNGWGRDSRFDVNYVEKILKAKNNVKGIEIIDPSTLRGITREGEGMADPTPRGGETESPTGTSNPAAPANVRAENLGGSIKVTWEKSPSPEVISFNVIRYTEGVEEYIVCSDVKTEFYCIDSSKLPKGTYTYNVYAYTGTGGLSQSSTQLTIN